MVTPLDNSFPFLEWVDGGAEKKCVGWTGLKGSSKAYLLSHFQEKVKSSLLIVVPLLQDAETLIEDLRFFEKRIKNSSLLFPHWETLPYDEIPPHPQMMRERVKCLFALLKGEEVVIVSPVKALMQKVIPPAELRQSTLSLSVGEEVDREPLVNFLQNGGYTSLRIAEERGDFSLRGAIIDIYSPLYDDPLRLEFDGDRLESIRRFETETQRSIPQSEMDTALLLPARDISADREDQSMGTLFDYLGKDGVVFIDDSDAVEKEARDFSRLIQSQYEKIRVKKSAVPVPGSIYLNSDDLSTRLERFQRVFLQDGPVVPPECRQTLSFEMESNDDLRREMKLALSGEASLAKPSPFSIFLKRLRDWQERGMRVLIVSHTSGQAERLRDLFSHYHVPCDLEKEMGFREALNHPPRQPLTLHIGPLSSGFRNLQEGWVLLTEEEIFGERRRLSAGRTGRGVRIASHKELQENGFVVHMDYGVGIYRGLRHLNIWGVSNDYLFLEYFDGDKLYVPVDRLNLIQRYIGSDDSLPKLDKLGSVVWQRKKARVKAALTEMVKELLDLYAARQAFEGFRFSSLDQFYREFEATFDYEETPDQIKAIDDVMKDMGNPKPMDRLICGDVGYGKTEVAVRAAGAAQSGGVVLN